MNNIIFAHLGYKQVNVEFEEYQRIYNSEVEFCSQTDWSKIPKGIDKHLLLSCHPYWRNYAKKQSRKYLHEIMDKIEICKADESKIKYLFNATETIHSLEIKLKQQIKSVYK